MGSHKSNGERKLDRDIILSNCVPGSKDPRRLEIDDQDPIQQFNDSRPAEAPRKAEVTPEVDEKWALKRLVQKKSRREEQDLEPQKYVSNEKIG